MGFGFGQPRLPAIGAGRAYFVAMTSPVSPLGNRGKSGVHTPDNPATTLYFTGLPVKSGTPLCGE